MNKHRIPWNKGIKGDKYKKYLYDVTKIKIMFLPMNKTKGMRISTVARKLDMNYTRTCTNLNKLYKLGFIGKVKTFGGFALYYNKMVRKND